MKKHEKIINIAVLAIFVIMTGVAVVVYKRLELPNLNLLNRPTVTFLEDPINHCSYTDGKITGGTLVEVPREKMVEVEVRKDKVDQYLKNAESEGRCVSRK